MKEKKRNGCCYVQDEHIVRRIKEVELDHGKPRKTPEKPVSDSKVIQDTLIVNPDENTLNRG